MSEIPVSRLNTSQICEFIVSHSTIQQQIDNGLHELNLRKINFISIGFSWTSSSEAWFNEFIEEIKKLYIAHNNSEIIFTDVQLNLINSMKSEIIDYRKSCDGIM